MTIEHEIYFSDLTEDAQQELLTDFETTEEDENWEYFPIFVMSREMDDEISDG